MASTAIDNSSLTVGSTVFIPCNQLIWAVAKVLEFRGSKVALQRLDNHAIVEFAQSTKFYFHDAEIQRETGLNAPNDLTQLTHLHEASVLESLHVRFKADSIYTFTGPILIALNPFKTLRGMYDDRQIQACRSVKNKTFPHLFTIANAAYTGICEREKSQSILISGESGAGKTESTKYVMKFLASAGATKGEGHSEIEKKVLESNPLLEAFGNARTLRNDNSSRFGKFIELQFRVSQTQTGLKGRLCGARIQTYLLEKVRVCNQQEGERNFHAFYQICVAAAHALKSSNGIYCFPQTNVKLQPNVQPQVMNFQGYEAVQKFSFLTKSSCQTLEGKNELTEFENTIYAMQTVGMGLDEQMDIFNVTTAVLCIGNISFNIPKNYSEGSEISSHGVEWAEKAAKFLNVSIKRLEEGLTHRTIRTSTEIIKKPLRVEEAKETRDALARSLYGTLFLKIVHRTNDTIGYLPEVSLFCGVLDIFGFECFETNSFEQICINFTNERLQFFFNNFVFKFEEALYQYEEIPWNKLDFPDNQDCIELFQEKHSGLFAMLDEECLVPSGNDRSYNYKLCQRHTSKQRFSAIKTKPNWFIVNHFAGSVSYCSDGFLDKNKDLLSEDAQTIIRESTNPFVSNLFIHFLNRGESSSRRRRSRGFVTVSSAFRDQLNDLMDRVDLTEPHFIRCIKPNNQNLPNLFERPSVNEQLRYGGVLQAVQVSRAGYPVRMAHEDFISDFIILIPLKEWSKFLLWKNRDKRCKDLATLLVKRILELYKFPKAIEGFYMWAVGKNKCFFKTEAYEVISSTRGRKRNRAATKIQAAIRGKLQRKRYQTLRSMAIYIQSWIRCFLCKKELQRRHIQKAALCLQTFIRSYLAKSRYQRFRFGIMELQRRWRNILGGRLRLHRFRNVKAAIIQSTWKMFTLRRKFLRLRFWLRVCYRRLRNVLKLLRLRKISVGYKMDELLLQNEALKEEMQISTKQKEDANIRFLHLKVNYEKLVAEKKSKEEISTKKLRLLSVRITKLEEEIQNLHKENGQLGGDLGKQKKANSTLMENFTNQEKLLNSQKTQLLALETEKAKFSSDLHAYRGENQKLEAAVDVLQQQNLLLDQEKSDLENSMRMLQKSLQTKSEKALDKFITAPELAVNGKPPLTFSENDVMALQRRNEELIAENEKLRRMKKMEMRGSTDLSHKPESTPSIAFLGWKESDKRDLLTEFLEERDPKAVKRFETLRPLEHADESVWISLPCVFDKMRVDCFDSPEKEENGLLDDPHSINVYSRVAFLFVVVNSSSRKTLKPVETFFRMLHKLSFIEAKIFLIYFSRDTHHGSHSEVSRREVDDLAFLYDVEVKEIQRSDTVEVLNSCLFSYEKPKNFINSLTTKLKSQMQFAASIDFSTFDSLMRNFSSETSKEKEFLRPTLPVDSFSLKGNTPWSRIVPVAYYEMPCPFQRLALSSCENRFRMLLALGGSNGYVHVLEIPRTQRELVYLQAMKSSEHAFSSEISTTFETVKAIKLHALFALGTGSITSLFFTCDNRYLIASLENSIFVMNMETGGKEKQYKDTGAITGCIPFPWNDHHILTITGGKILRTVSLQTNKSISRKPLNFTATTMTFNNRGDLLFVGSDNGRVYTFNVIEDSSLHKNENGFTVSETPILLLDCWSFTSKSSSLMPLLIVGTRDCVSTYPLDVFNVNFGKQMSPNWSHRVPLPNHVIRGCSNAKNGNWYIFGSESRQVFVLSREDGTSEHPRITVNTIGRHHPICDVVVSTDGYLMVCSVRGGQLELFRRVAAK